MLEISRTAINIVLNPYQMFGSSWHNVNIAIGNSMSRFSLRAEEISSKISQRTIGAVRICHDHPGTCLSTDSGNSLVVRGNHHCVQSARFQRLLVGTDDHWDAQNWHQRLSREAG